MASSAVKIGESVSSSRYCRKSPESGNRRRRVVLDELVKQLVMLSGSEIKFELTRPTTPRVRSEPRWGVARKTTR